MYLENIAFVFTSQHVKNNLINESFSIMFSYVSTSKLSSHSYFNYIEVLYTAVEHTTTYNVGVHFLYIIFHLNIFKQHFANVYSELLFEKIYKV